MDRIFLSIYDSFCDFDIVNLGESKTVETLDLIRLLEQKLGIPAKVTLLPSQAGDVEKTYADISKAKEKYGYQPGYTIEEGTPRFIE